MPDIPALTLFLITAWLLLITPGPAVLYIVARSIDQGRIAGIVSTLGVAFGTLSHVGAAGPCRGVCGPAAGSSFTGRCESAIA